MAWKPQGQADLSCLDASVYATLLCMKYANLRAFEKHLESSLPQHCSDIYMIMSKEDFERKTAVDLLVKGISQGKTPDPLSLQVFDADKHQIADLLAELETLPLFSKKKIIVVYQADKFDKASTARLEEYFAAPNRSICLVLVASAINRATNFYKKAEKIGIVFDAAEEKPWDKEKSLAEWLRIQAAAYGKRIDASICQLLIKQLGTDQSLLQQELLKLICYVGERPAISEQDAAAICGRVSQENAWQLGEAIFRKDGASAVRISRALLDSGVAEIALLRQVRSQFQTEFTLCSILMNGGGRDEITRAYPYMKGQILERHMQLAGSYGISRFKEGLLNIDQTELQVKSSSVDSSLLIEALMIKLTSK